jgi:hypothetical protein
VFASISEEPPYEPKGGEQMVKKIKSKLTRARHGEYPVVNLAAFGGSAGAAVALGVALVKNVFGNNDSDN